MPQEGVAAAAPGVDLLPRWRTRCSYACFSSARAARNSSRAADSLPSSSSNSRRLCGSISPRATGPPRRARRILHHHAHLENVPVSQGAPGWSGRGRSIAARRRAEHQSLSLPLDGQGKNQNVSNLGHGRASLKAYGELIKDSAPLYPSALHGHEYHQTIPYPRIAVKHARVADSVQPSPIDL